MARFDGGQLSSDGGGLLLREVERRTGLLGQFAACFRDYRNPLLVEHTRKESDQPTGDGTGAGLRGSERP